MQKKKIITKIFKALILTSVFISIDLISKNYFIFREVGFMNYGFSWGMGSNTSLALSLLATGFFNLLLLFFLWTYKNDRLLANSLLMILSGGLGNMISRILWGGVWDWITIWKFPSFNFADILISVGTLFFVISLLQIPNIRSVLSFVSSKVDNETH